MLWSHAKIPVLRDKYLCLRYPLCFSATADKAVQTTSNKTTDNNFHTNYILHFIFAQDKFLRLDTTFFLHKSKYKLLIEM